MLRTSRVSLSVASNTFVVPAGVTTLLVSPRSIDGRLFAANNAYHSVVIDRNYNAWAWGAAGNGRLGDNTTVDKSSPVQVVGGHKFVQVSAGSSHSLALDASGNVWAWGNASAGQLGDNTTVDKSSPVRVVGGITFNINPNPTFMSIQVTPGQTITASFTANSCFLNVSGCVWTGVYNFIDIVY